MKTSFWLPPLAWLALSHASYAYEVVPRVSDDAATRQSLQTFAECVVARDRAATISFLERGQGARPGNREVRALVQRNSRCLRGEPIGFNQVLFAGAAAEVIYRESGFKFAENRSAAAAAELDSSGSCVALMQPAEVDALFATALNSPEEEAALASLAEAIGICMPDVSPRSSLRRASIAMHGFEFYRAVHAGQETGESLRLVAPNR